MLKKFAILLLLCFILVSNGVFAMMPRVQFPEWNKTTIKITDWDPVTGILTLTVEVEANKIPIEKVYSKPYLQNNFKKSLPKYEKENIKQGDKAVFIHKLNIKNNTSNWIEMDVRAKPDITGLKLLIRSQYPNNPTMKEILEAEADNIKSPIFIGTSMPILARDDIAMKVTPEIAFTPKFSHKDINYYIWLPLDTAESKTTNSAIKLFKEAIKDKNFKTVEASGENLIKRFETNKRTITFKKSNGDNFAIPTKIAKEMIQADIVCIRMILTGETEKLEKTYSSMNPSYTKAFIAYNLYAFFKSINQNDKAEKYKKEALSEQPAWPLLKNNN